MSLLTARIFRYSLRAAGRRRRPGGFPSTSQRFHVFDRSDHQTGFPKSGEKTFCVLGCFFFFQSSLTSSSFSFLLSMIERKRRRSSDTFNGLRAGGCKYTLIQIRPGSKWNSSVSLWRRVISIKRRSETAFKHNVRPFFFFFFWSAKASFSQLRRYFANLSLASVAMEMENKQ